MIINERLVTYINSLKDDNTELLNCIEKEALEAFVPIIRPEMQTFLKVLLALKRPGRILEVGTAVGFSALLMAEYNPILAEIVTIENYEKRIPIARANFKRAGRQEQITLLEGDAADWLKKLEEPFDFIFMDAAKGQYIHFLDDVLRLLNPNGILISDNVLQDGNIIESRFAVTRRDRTIHKRMRDYLYQLTHHRQLQTSVLPFGDGVTVSVKSEQEK
ncbi:protein-L-isoaspartate O-methyltransferase [uncultured Roseburia sp.]|uniref:tRNA 5-hydroxyuridine methyltransferase n=1 Tax=Brotonthovivens ammoniilytica TaxID=2981725 RepID=A0ABT2TMD2_9FIRM|nr:O-methyltransferase [Brotonthovivens ammoniilytica]MCU6763387.1 O-methyltransferase [Brotonthovivens ammoniilytica]SCJ17540.1 protein-L-isoaspartate O-methyltransferase [uncultured Roseburia sp.]